MSLIMEYSKSIHLEIERKFLINIPDIGLLEGSPGAVKYEIEQIYLPERGGITERIRKMTGKDGTRYFHTAKRRLTDLTRIEDEREIYESDYLRIKNNAEETLRTTGSGAVLPVISKTRWCIPHDGFVAEIDIFPFWRRMAYAELELEREDSDFRLPFFLHVIRDVTCDPRFTNKALADALTEGRTAELENEIMGGH